MILHLIITHISIINFYFLNFFFQKIFYKIKNTPLPNNIISVYNILTKNFRALSLFFINYKKTKYLIFYDFLKGWLIPSLPIYLCFV